MTDTKIPEAPAGSSSPPGHPGGASSPGEVQGSETGASACPVGQTFCIGSWILRFLGKEARADYQRKVSKLNHDLTEYLKATEYLSVSDRLEICEGPPSFYQRLGAFWFIHSVPTLIRFRPVKDNELSSGQGPDEGDDGKPPPGKQVPPSIELMNAYQAWEPVFNRYIWAIACLAVFPLWLVCATAASVLVGASQSFIVKLVYLCILALFVVRVFAAYLRIKDRESVANLTPGNLRLIFGMLLGLSDRQPVRSHRQPVSAGEEPVRPDEQPVPVGWLRTSLSWMIDLSPVAVSGWFLYGPWSNLGPPEASGALLLSMLGTFMVAIAAVCLVVIAESNTGRVRMIAVAVYLAGAAALLPAARLRHPGWPSWLVHGTWSAIWASLILVGVLAGISLICYLARVSLWHRKNRRHVVEELIQTLTWLGQRLEDHEIKDRDRKLGIFEDLEYTAGLIQNYLPKVLRTRDPAGESGVAEQCRGMAAAFRELKLEVALNQSMSRSEIAGRIVPTIGPIFHGAWEEMPCIASQGLAASSRLKRTARGLSQTVVAVVPLAALLALHKLGIVNGSVFDHTLPIVVTWLVVSVFTWIDPRAESSISSVDSVLSILH
jgi:hypothetical protein